MNTAERSTLTPPAIARRYGVAVEKVVGWIKRGELRGINIASRRDGKKPRYVVHVADLAEFEQNRAAVPAVRPVRRRRNSAAGITEYV